MKTTKIILAAVLCAASMFIGCRSAGPVNEPVDEDPVVLESDPEPAPAPAPTQDPQIEELKAQVAALTAAVQSNTSTAAASAPVNSTTASAPTPVPTRVDDDPDPAPTPPQAEPVDEPEPELELIPMPNMPEYAALVFLRKDREIMLEGLRRSQMWGDDMKPDKNYVGICMARRADRVHMLNYNPMRDTTNRTGKVDVDSRHFVKPHHKRAQRFEINGRTVRDIVFRVTNEDGTTTDWSFRFYPVPDQVMETMLDGSIVWSVWGNTVSGGHTEIGSRSFAQDTVALDAGSGITFVAQGREDNTHQWGTRVINP